MFKNKLACVSTLTAALILVCGGAWAGTIIPAPGISLDATGHIPLALEQPNAVGIDARLYLGSSGCDGMKLADITATASSAVISSASYTFTASDIGKLITVAGAGASGAVLNTTIASTSGGNATLSAAPSTSLAGNGVASFGTDQTAHMQLAANAASTLGAARVLLPVGVCVHKTITVASQVSFQGHGAGKTILKWISASDMTTAMFQGLSGSSSNPYTDNQFTDMEVDLDAATQATYNVAGKGFYFQYMVRPVFRGLYVHGAPASGIGVDYVKDGLFEGNTLISNGRLNGGTNLGGAGIGIAVGSAVVNENSTVIGNTFIGNATYGVFFEAQTTTTTVASYARVEGNYAYLTTAGAHGIGDDGLQRFDCIGNQVVGQAGISMGDGITVHTGTIFGSPGIEGLIAHNVIRNTNNGISILYNSVAPSVTPTRYVLDANKITDVYNFGINIQSGASYVITTLDIKGNLISGSKAAGLYLGGTAGFKDLQVETNTIENNGNGTGTAAYKAGITLVAPITRMRLVANSIYDNQGTPTQNYAIINNGAAVTGAWIAANDLTHNGTGVLSTVSGSIVGAWVNNNGYTLTVGTLPTCGASGLGSVIPVTDATSPAYNGALTGGGTITIPAFCNGTAWTAH